MQANFRSEKQHQRNRMFGNRKRKPQDNEESLVPHGLIWHATAEPAPEEPTPKEDSLGHTVQFAEMIETETSFAGDQRRVFFASVVASAAARV